jgi:O-antigen/teichoic acid export membrane protein
MTWTRDFVRVGVPLIVVPLVLAFYTPEEQTFYFMIQILVSFTIIADAGISSVLMRATSYFLAGAKQIPKNKKEFDSVEGAENKEMNKEGIAELFHTTRWIYLIITLITIVLLLTAGVAMFWNLMEQVDHRKDMWMAYGFLVGYLVMLMINMRWSAFMRGLNFVAIEARFSTLTIGTRLVIWIVLLSLKFKPVALTAVMLLEGMALHIFYRVFIYNWFRQNDIIVSLKAKFNKQLFMSIWPASWRMGGIQLGNFFVERGNNILILQIQDTAMMANFTFTTWILKTIFNFSLTPVYSKLPVLFRYAAEKNFDKLKRSAGSFMFIGLMLIASAYLIIGIAGNPILEALDYDRRLIFPIGLFAIMALTEILDIHSSFHAGVYTSTNHIPFFWPSVISGASIFLIGYYYSLPLYGLTGIILTRFFVQLSFNNWFAMYLNLRFLKWPIYKFIVDVPKFGIQFLFNRASEMIPFFSKK